MEDPEPQDVPSCLYKGSIARGATRSKVAPTTTRGTADAASRPPPPSSCGVDGVRVGRKAGAVGTIDNRIPMTTGGKINCDQVKGDLRLLLRPDRLRPGPPGQLSARSIRPASPAEDPCRVLNAG